MKHSLEVDSIILEFDQQRILQNVSLKTETGKTTGILGRNGTGKTCLMNVIYGELKTTNKSIRSKQYRAVLRRKNGKFCSNNKCGINRVYDRYCSIQYFKKHREAINTNTGFYCL